MRQVLCWEVWGIYADYDAEAPTTEDLILCSTEELAKEVVADFNKNPRDVTLAYVEGCEGFKRFDYHVVYVLDPTNVRHSVDEIEEYGGNSESDDSDGEDF